MTAAVTERCSAHGRMICIRSLSLKMLASLEHELTAETAKIAENYFTTVL
jgi:hypothetical protein